jgi:hypothetical protein
MMKLKMHGETHRAFTDDRFRISLTIFPFWSFPIAPKNNKSFCPSAASILDEFNELPPSENFMCLYL